MIIPEGNIMMARFPAPMAGWSGIVPTVVDAIVMATAAEKGALVYTSDFDDLIHLQSRFPNVRVLKTTSPVGKITFSRFLDTCVPRRSLLT